MGVDLTKPTDQPQPEPADDDQALTAREELLRSLKACGAAIAAGSPLLLRWIARTLWRAVRDGSRTRTSGEGGIADLAERLALGALVVALGGSALAGLLGAVWLVVAPYAGWAGLGLILAWCVAAMCFAVAAPEDDQETAGEEEPDDEAPGEEDEGQAEDAWEDAREKLRVFVERRAAEVAAGHVEGVKGKGVRVDDLLAEQQRNGALLGVGRSGMIELLQRAGITVRSQMSFRVLEDTGNGQEWVKKNVPGVHVEDLAKDLRRTPHLPPHLVPDLTPTPHPKRPSDGAAIPAPREAGE
ncbi:hypothetical protein [Streptomyces sp. enrichment culture]|uniref:hypothetical protein n=1 Tax=Streptomyces sp. enrichment culture TaxID=1795815 RepID=UPI003F575B29